MLSGVFFGDRVVVQELRSRWVYKYIKILHNFGLYMILNITYPERGWRPQELRGRYHWCKRTFRHRCQRGWLRCHWGNCQSAGLQRVEIGGCVRCSWSSRRGGEAWWQSWKIVEKSCMTSLRVQFLSIIKNSCQRPLIFWQFNNVPPEIRTIYNSCPIFHFFPTLLGRTSVGVARSKFSTIVRQPEHLLILLHLWATV